MDNRTEIHDAASTRKAICLADPKNSLVVFGHMHGAEFAAAYGKPSRTYKTMKGARNAMTRWAYQGK